MAEIEEEVVFHTRADQVTFHTKTNGDKIIITNFHFDQGQAASMAWLVNADDSAELEFAVKVKEA